LIRGRTKVFDFRNSFRSRKRIFEDLYRKGGWGDDETRSGTGSTLKNTQRIIQQLPTLLRQYTINSILDIPCGDFNWMKKVDLGSTTYIGADIVPDLIVKNKKEFENHLHSFIVADVVTDTLPQADLILCRDCLVHLSNEDAFEALKNIRRSGAKYFLATTFPKHDNMNIVTGSWRPLNLQRHPFHFSEPIEILYEEYFEMGDQYSDKALGLWEVKCIPDNL
jgi:SAM-dependent methyltransferase